MTFRWSRQDSVRADADPRRIGRTSWITTNTRNRHRRRAGLAGVVEWVKDYYRDVETYDWVDVADNLRGLEAFFHRNQAAPFASCGQVRAARWTVWTPAAEPVSTFGTCQGSTGLDINPRNVARRHRLPEHVVVEGDIERAVRRRHVRDHRAPGDQAHSGPSLRSEFRRVGRAER
jgi:hypothetical protein